MKRLLILAAALSLAGYAYGQEPSAINKADYAAPKSGGALTVPPGYLTIRDETTDRTTRAVLTFLGAGVTCADSIANLATECTIPGGAGAVATDAIWDAAGDLVVGTGADTAAKLTKGADGKVLTMTAGAVGWASLPAAAGSVLLQASSPGTPDVGNFNITGVGTSTHDNIHATLTPGLFLSNTQAALVGQQQEYSPSMKMCGAGWNIGGAASETDCWQIFARPIAGSPSTIDLVFQASIAGGAYAPQAYLQSNGHFTLGESGTTVGRLSFLNATSGAIDLVPATGALGSKTLVLPAVNGTVAYLESPPLTTPTVGNGATGPGSFNVLEDSDNGTSYIQTIGQSSLSANRVYTLPDIGGDGTYSVSPTNYPLLGYDPRTGFRFFEEFMGRATVSSTTATGLGQCWVLGVGTGSGYQVPGAGAGFTGTLANTAPGIAAVQTGTTTTGVGAIMCGYASSAPGNEQGFTLAGNEILEIRFTVPQISVAPDKFRTLVGLCDDTTASACADEAAIYWDNSADTHWGCETASNTSVTTTLSSTAATATAWHTARFEVNSDDTSIAMSIDGSALSCSPMTTTLPKGINRGLAIMLKVVAAADSGGCNTAGDCTVGADYVYLYKPISR